MRRTAAVGLVDKSSRIQAMYIFVPLPSPGPIESDGAVNGAGKLELQTHEPAYLYILFRRIYELTRNNNDVPLFKYGKINIQCELGLIDIFEFECLSRTICRG